MFSVLDRESCGKEIQMSIGVCLSAERGSGSLLCLLGSSLHCLEFSPQGNEEQEVTTLQFKWRVPQLASWPNTKGKIEPF